MGKAAVAIESVSSCYYGFQKRIGRGEAHIYTRQQYAAVHARSVHGAIIPLCVCECARRRLGLQRMGVVSRKERKDPSKAEDTGYDGVRVTACRVYACVSIPPVGVMPEPIRAN